MNKIILSILIPTYNRAEYLEKCLNSIDYRGDIEVIISDNDSKYSVESLVPKKIKEITSVYKRKYNVGPKLNIAEIGLHAKGKYLLYISDDDVFIEGGIENAINAIKCGAFDIAFFSLYVNKIVSKKNHYYGFLYIFNKKISAIVRAQVLTGCLMNREYFLDVYEKNKIVINNSWYMLIIFVLEAKKIKLFPRANAVHIWENETYWGVNPSKSTDLLNLDKLQKYKDAYKNNKMSWAELFILKSLDSKMGLIISAILFRISRLINE